MSLEEMPSVLGTRHFYVWVYSVSVGGSYNQRPGAWCQQGNMGLKRSGCTVIPWLLQRPRVASATLLWRLGNILYLSSHRMEQLSLAGWQRERRPIKHLPHLGETSTRSYIPIFHIFSKSHVDRRSSYHSYQHVETIPVFSNTPQWTQQELQ